MLGALLMLLGLGVVAVVALGMVFAIFGLVVGAASFLLFKVAPILLIGWVVLKLVGRARNPRRISAADQRWLDGE
jgi:hypothetical protein